MVSRKGQAIRFHETDVRPMGRDASGRDEARMLGELQSTPGTEVETAGPA